MSKTQITNSIVKTMNVPIKMPPTESLEESLTLTTSTEIATISTIPTTYLNDEATNTNPIFFPTNAPIEVIANEIISRGFK